MAQAETKTCQNCKQVFTIEPDDFNFYEKMGVPPPTFCPECRLKRKLTFRNLRSLYKRKCDAPGHTEDLISMYGAHHPVKVYDDRYWWSDAWDAQEYGRPYEFSKPFFAQLKELMNAVPWPNVTLTNCLNSDYCNSALGLKSCYLVFAGVDSENCAYGEQLEHCRDSFDIKACYQDELCYELYKCRGCYGVFFSAFSESCNESAFLLDCRGCNHCFGCVGLRNKSYCIFNRPYPPAEYLAMKDSISIDNFEKIEDIKRRFGDHVLKFPRKYARIDYSTDSTGDDLKSAKHCRECFDATEATGMENSRYVVHPYGKGVKDCDSLFTASLTELCYDSISIRDCYNVRFSKKIWTGHDVQYSYNCHNCNHIFGCVGLRNKSYCILNAPCAEGEYEKRVAEITEHMNKAPYVDANGRTYGRGEYFSPDISPFFYNETVAQEYYPLDEDQSRMLGYHWHRPEEKHYEITLPAQNIPSDIGEVSDDISKEVIGCAHGGKCNHQCTTAFRIIPEELAFHRKMNIALPRLCPNCRYCERNTWRNPFKLWRRKCQCSGAKSENSVYQNASAHFHGTSHCSNEFETSYSPDRKEIVYCEQCYNSEVV